ncbi:EndoS/ChiA family endoglycosidase [Streptococcus catagoni]|uniref:EndoS/ChiA family endoglycosidase n=1 Tax=Streptococcus catagoni TaxID=2654874 RepID=UPI00140A2C9B|nr:hypothetical protein [Streptococcus catagoni]
MDKRLVVKRALGGVCAGVLIAVALQSSPQLSFSNWQPDIVFAEEKAQEGSHLVEQIRRGEKGPLYAGYFRTWHDSSSTGKDGKQHHPENTMKDIPKEVDMVFVFHNETADNSPFWSDLKNAYIPKLHKQGTAVIQTIGFNFLVGKAGISKDQADKYSDTEEGNRLLAQDIVKTYVYDRGVDGLDIDIEPHDYNAGSPEAQRALVVYKEIAKLIGKSGTDKSKLLIMDTTLKPSRNPLFQEVAPSTDLVLRQFYGMQGERELDSDWEEFKNYISPSQYMIGFTFYEENAGQGNIWHDINDYDPADPDKGSRIEGTRAERYAKWQPKTGGVKAGIFSYAIDRDGVAHQPKSLDSNPGIEHPTDKVVKSEYKVSKALKDLMISDKAYNEINEKDFKDPALLKAVKEQVGKFRGDLALYDGTLILNDPAIKDLSGLSQLKQLGKLKLQGLTQLKALSSKDLPKSILKSGQLDLSGMTSLESLKLKDSQLESLTQLDVPHLTALKSFDISKNRMDLLGEEALLTQILTTVSQNGAKSDADKAFSGQKPVGYYPKEYASKNVKLAADGKDHDIFKEYVLGTVTKAATLIKDSQEFEEFKQKELAGQKLIAADYTYDQFVVSYDKFTVEQVDDTLSESQDKVIKTDKDSTRQIKVYNASKELIHKMTAVIGNGPSMRTNLAKGADVLYGNKEMVTRAIDDDRSTYYFDWNPQSHFVLDLGKLVNANYWRLYNAEVLKNRYSAKDYNVASASLQVLKDSSVDLSSKTKEEQEAISNDDSQWRTVASVNEAGAIIEGKLDDALGRYWRFDIKGSVNPKNPPYVVELQILGTAMDVSTFDHSLANAKKVGEDHTKALSKTVISDYNKQITEISSQLKSADLSQEKVTELSQQLDLLAANLQKSASLKEDAYKAQEASKAARLKVKDKIFKTEDLDKVKALETELVSLEHQIDEKLGKETYDADLESYIVSVNVKVSELTKISPTTEKN